MTAPDAHFPPRPTALAQELLSSLIEEGDTVIDATAGNGHDTLFLAGRVGEQGRVLAFDVQEAAISSASKRLSMAGFADRVVFFRESHEFMATRVALETVAAIMFNLGYLPGQDHEVITNPAATLAALKAASDLLRPGGVMSVVCYPGHEGGATEAMLAEEYVASLTGLGFRVAKYAALGTRKPAPFLLVARK